MIPSKAVLHGSVLLVLAAPAAAETAVFADATAESRIDFVHDPAVTGNYFMPESIGSGCALLDYDGDGDLDVYLLSGVGNRLFRQESGGTFHDVTEPSGLGDSGYGMGVAVGDIDGDGDPDVYVTNYAADALYRNDGGTFTDITESAGIDNSSWGASAVFFDADGDGDPDLYVTNYLLYSPPMVCSDFAGRPDYCGPTAFSGVSDRLYRNDGGGADGIVKFADITQAAGISRAASRGLGVVSADFNGDRLADVYVSNDGQPNQLWINRGGARFEDEAVLMGAAVNVLGQPEAGMGIAFGDTEGDGGTDLFVTHLRTETNTFYQDAGELGFVDASTAAGLDGPSLSFTGFGTGFFDYDNDGDLDLAVVNGRVTRGPLRTPRTADREPAYWDAYAEPNVLFVNDGQGRFHNASDQAGALWSLVENSRGLALGDVDNDGDVDLLVANEGGPARLLRNELGQGKNWLGARLADGASASVVVGQRQLHRTAAAGYSFLSSSDPRVHFGLDRTAAVDQLQIRWPDGKTQHIHNLPVNRWIVIAP